MSDHLHPEKLGALVDGELSPLDEAAAEQHLNECHACSMKALGLHQLRSATKLAAHCNMPSPEVLARLSAGVRKNEEHRSRSVPRLPIAWQIAAALVLAAAVTLGWWRWVRQPDSFAVELLDQHLSTLAQSSQPEVVSSDRHAVKPWFEGKLPFSFNLPDPNALPADTVLNGADLVYIDGRPTALLLFTIHKHRTSVFVRQASLYAGLLGRQTRSGFELIEKKSAGLEFVGVSDVNAGELDALVHSLTAAQ
jgi:anti-sigma factor RsiW